MAENSYPWPSTGGGDADTYTNDEFRDWLYNLVGLRDTDHDDFGVLLGFENNLDVSSTGNNNVRVATGRALVNGTFYKNTTNADITVSSPSVGTTGWICTLRKSWSGQTVRATVTKNTDGTAAIPALTQTDGTTWDIPLAQGTITTGGVIAITGDTRRYIGEHAVDDDSRMLFVDWSIVSGATIATGDFFTETGAVSLAVHNNRIAFQLDGSTTDELSSALVIQADMSPHAKFNAEFDGAGGGDLAIGFTNDTDATIFDGTADHIAGIHQSATGNLFFYTANASTNESTDLGAAPAGWNSFEIFTNDAGLTWVCVQEGSVVAVHSTSVPTVTQGMSFFIGSAVAGQLWANAAQVWVDQV